jgi:hypothetical protein
MKKITLLVATVLLLGNFAKAAELKNNTATEKGTRFSADEPIEFNERGIAFYVFSNGEFDFNTRPDDSQGDYHFKGAGKRGAMTTNRGPENYGVIIEQDSYGRVRRVGNTFINYDFNDRVSRIGSVYMRYNRFALAQVGGLQLVYNHYGDIVDMIGSVKGHRSGFTYNYYGNSYQVQNHFEDYNCNSSNSMSYNSNDYYYYKADGTRAKIEDKK